MKASTLGSSLCKLRVWVLGFESVCLHGFEGRLQALPQITTILVGLCPRATSHCHPKCVQPSCCTGCPACGKVLGLTACTIVAEFVSMTSLPNCRAPSLNNLGRTYVMMGCVLYFFAIIVMPACVRARCFKRLSQQMRTS